MKKFLQLFLPILLLFVSYTKDAKAQCGFATGYGCPGTDYTNFGMNSNNDASKIEYDNFVSTFHSTLVREYDGGFKVWGEMSKSKSGAAYNGTDVSWLVPTSINSSNFSGLTGSPIKATIGSDGGYGPQFFVLTSDNKLWVWGNQRAVLQPSVGLTSGTALQVLNTGVNGLPAGVLAKNVKSLFATTGSLALLTCDGDVYVLSKVAAMRGNGSTGNSNTWYRVKTGSGSSAFLTNISVLRGSSAGFIALGQDGNLWTWGGTTYIGNGSGSSTRSYATQMNLPNNSSAIKMIGTSGTGPESISQYPSASNWHADRITYYVLYTDGNLYSLGEGRNGELGNFGRSNSNTWTRPRYTSSNGPVMNDIHWIEPNAHDFYYPFINVLNKDSTLYNWGRESGYHLGRNHSSTADYGVIDPGQPSSLAGRKVIAVASGGHTTMVSVLCEDNFGYVGHKTHGSMGDGSNADEDGQQNFSFFTAAVQACGAETKPVIDVTGSPIIGPGGGICASQIIKLKGTPNTGTFTVETGSGVIANGNELTYTGTGTGSVLVKYTVPGSCEPGYVFKEIDFTTCTLYEISGTVFIDVNQDAVLDNDEQGTNASSTSFSGLWANLINASGDVVASVPVNTDGSYTLSTLLNATYSVQITNEQVGIGTSIDNSSLELPGLWNYTGNNRSNSNICKVPSCLNPSIITGIVVGGSNVSGINFGIMIEETNLSIDKRSDVENYFKAGDTITYTIKVRNEDDFNHTNVQVIDDLPAGVSFVSGSVQGAVGNPIPDEPGENIVTEFNSGAGTFSVPEGVVSIKVQTWGGGGRGSTRNSNGSGGGGGGGAYSESTITVTPSTTYYYSVGAGSTSTSAGGDSWFSTTSNSNNAIVLAKGGSTSANNSNSGASGGSANAGLGQIKYSGGNGGNGGTGTSPSGGGGSSAGFVATGNNANGINGGTAPSGGGDGGDGVSSNTGNGNSGSTPGGGGGGGKRRNGSGTFLGGSGATGKVIISYQTSAISSDGAIGNPPMLANGWTIQSGDSLTITYKVVVNTPLDVDFIENIASATSSHLSEPIRDTVIDHPYNTTNAVNDENSTWVNTPVDGDVTTNDFDLEDNTQTFGSFLNQDGSGTAISSGATVSGKDIDSNPVSNAGNLTFGPNGTYTYTPATDFIGSISVPYSICDDGRPQACDTAYLDITVSDLPNGDNSVIANNDEYYSYGDPIISDITINDADPQGDNFTVTSYRYDSNGDGVADATGIIGTSVIVGGVDEQGNSVSNAGILIQNANGTFTFVPEEGFAGKVTYNYTITDDYDTDPAKDDAIVVITVVRKQNGPANDPPVAGDDFSYTTINTPVKGNYIGNDSDPNEDPLSYKGVTIDPNGPATPIDSLITVEGGKVVLNQDGTYTYTPPTDYIGPDRVEYEICDVTVIEPQPLCANATIHMLIGPGFNLSGNVFNDANGMNDNKVNGLGTNADEKIYAVLTDAEGKVIRSVLVNSDGFYEFEDVSGGQQLLVVLDTLARTEGEIVITSTLPEGWVSTGEIIGEVNIATGEDGNINGESVDFRGRQDVAHINFGINRLPFADEKTYVLPHQAFKEGAPTGYPDLSSPTERYFYIPTSDENLSGYTHKGLLTGSDAEDCPSDGSCNLGNTFKVNSIYPSTELFYNYGGETGVRALRAGDSIPNYNPTLLMIYAKEGTGMGDTTGGVLSGNPVGFEYSIVDAAGFWSEPAPYTILTDNALPVELLYFTAQAQGCDVVLEWATASEDNNDYFEVQSSADAVNWNAVGQVTGSGNSNLPVYYSYVDESVAHGRVYYRLKQVDYSGATEYHKVVSVSSRVCDQSSIRIYPNPTRQVLQLEINNKNLKHLQISIVDMTGRTIKSLGRDVQSIQPVDVSSMPNGTYFIRVDDSNKGQTETYPFVIVN